MKYIIPYLLYVLFRVMIVLSFGIHYLTEIMYKQKLEHILQIKGVVIYSLKFSKEIKASFKIDIQSVN